MSDDSGIRRLQLSRLQRHALEVAIDERSRRVKQADAQLQAVVAAVLEDAGVDHYQSATPVVVGGALVALDVKGNNPFAHEEEQDG